MKRLLPQFLGVAVLAWASALDVAPTWGQTITTRQSTFGIPFRVSQAGAAASGGPQAASPVEVQLHVSEDRGAKWKLHAKARADESRFNFRAEHDGEYWFCVRTKDAQGRLLPDRPPSPELQVLVDTTPPKLDLNAWRGNSGELNVHWQISDASLQPHTLRLECQAAQSVEPWQVIAIDPRRTQINAASYTGDATWNVAQADRALTVRAEVADAAGNRTISQAQIAAIVPSANPALTMPGASPVPPPNAAATHPPVTNDTPRSAGEPATNNPANTTWPVDQLALVPLVRSPARGLPHPATSISTAEQNPAATGVSQSELGAAGGLAAIRRLPRITDGEDVSTAVSPQPPIEQPSLAEIRRYPPPAQPPQGSTIGPSSVNASADPPGERIQRVNSRSFQLEYEVESIGPWGIRKVELWGTRDGGRTWSSFGIDADNRSPLTATVDGEGVYGFRILVQSGNGLVDRPPQPGDKPETWVGVDLTRPVCRLTQLEQGAGERSAELVIGWESSDLAPANRPAMLAFSDNLQGPWTTIATGLEASGTYTWQLDNRVPQRLFLRLEVRDEAGNLAAWQTSEAFVLDLARPRGHIRQVRPAP